MEPKEERPRRKPLRLEPALYAEGWYFVTVVTRGRAPLLGQIRRPDVVIPTKTGRCAWQALQDLQRRYPGVRVDKAVLMPDHLHIIFELQAGSPPLGRIIGGWKAGVSREMGKSIWQRSFYDHIIRGAQDYQEIWKYIDDNPRRWLVKHGRMEE